MFRKDKLVLLLHTNNKPFDSQNFCNKSFTFFHLFTDIITIDNTLEISNDSSLSNSLIDSTNFFTFFIYCVHSFSRIICLNMCNSNIRLISKIFCCWSRKWQGRYIIVFDTLDLVMCLIIELPIMQMLHLVLLLSLSLFRARNFLFSPLLYDLHYFSI